MDIKTYEIKIWRIQLKKVLMNFIVSNNYKRKQDSSAIYDLSFQVRRKQKLSNTSKLIKKRKDKGTYH